MIFHRVLFVALLAASATWALPQRQRQSPLSMGMRFLGNIRDGISNTFQGIFGGGNVRQNKEQHPGRPFQQQLVPRPPPPHGAPPPPPPGPHGVPEAVHHGSSDPTAPPSSFFTVVHEPVEASTSFPDIQGFTDESFKPSSFFTGNTPFQGTVEEEELPFANEVNQPHGIPRPPSFLVTHDPDADKHNPQNSFSSFGKTQHDSGIPFGNSASFSLGKLRDTPSPAPFPSHEARDSPRPVVHSPAPTPFVHRPTTSRAPVRTEPTVRPFVQRLHPTTFTLRSQPTHRPFAPIKPKPSSTLFKASSPIKALEDINKPPKHVQPHVEVRAQPSLAPLPLRTEAAPLPLSVHETRPQREAFKKPSHPSKIGGGHINTGTKMTVISTQNEDGSQATKVKGYEFGYGVLDGVTGNQYFHAEKREEGLTKGSYKIQLPDGRIQTVTYVADGNGFHPKITYEGEAKYPDTKPTDAA